MPAPSSLVVRPRSVAPHEAMPRGRDRFKRDRLRSLGISLEACRESSAPSRPSHSNVPYALTSAPMCWFVPPVSGNSRPLIANCPENGVET